MVKIENNTLIIEDGDSGRYMLTVTDKISGLHDEKVFLIATPFKGACTMYCMNKWKELDTASDARTFSTARTSETCLLSDYVTAPSGHRLFYLAASVNDSSSTDNRFDIGVGSGHLIFYVGVSSEYSDTLTVKQYDSSNNIKYTSEAFSGFNSDKSVTWNKIELDVQQSDKIILTYTKDSSIARGWDSAFLAFPSERSLSVFGEYTPSVQ